jgi:glycosyltransferase involved in cell wall biosynthesis
MSRSPAPCLPDIGVMGLVPDPWSDSWQTRHHILSRLARYFRVQWMNPAVEWRQVWRSPLLHLQAKRHPLPGLEVYSPDLWLPQLYRPRWLAEVFWRARLRNGLGALHRAGCQRVVLYLWRPEFSPVLDTLVHDASCYHVDDEYNFEDAEAPVSEEEARLLRRVDQVFIHSPGLLEKKGKFNPHTLVIPNGVDYERYAQLAVEPSDLAPISHPRIGYTGWIKKQLDWSLIVSLAVKHPGWSFVFTGDRKPHPEIEASLRELEQLPNVYFLGAKTVAELATYPQHFDVCIMPYQVNTYTDYIYPLKLHEYLASGRPVVGAPIRSLKAFSAFVALPESIDAWSTALHEALRPQSNSPERRTARQAVAQEHDWDVLVARIAIKLAGSLGDGYRRRLEAAMNPLLVTAVKEPLHC